jgi:hypothetical protein
MARRRSFDWRGVIHRPERRCGLCCLWIGGVKSCGGGVIIVPTVGRGMEGGL